MKIYLTGISGTGKTCIVKSLVTRDIKAIDIDDELCHWENKHTGAKGDWQPGSNDEWHESHLWLCNIERLKEQLAETENVVVAGVASNQDDYLKCFDKVFVLRCSPKTAVARIEAREDNEFGKHPAEQQRILNWQQEFETEMVKKGALPLNVEQPLAIVVEEIVGALK